MQLVFLCVVLFNFYLTSSLAGNNSPVVLQDEKPHEPDLKKILSSNQDYLKNEKTNVPDLNKILSSNQDYLKNIRQFRPDYVYRREAKGWFKFHEIPATWENARAKCFHEGAVLASPITKQLHSAMQDILKNQGHMAFTGIQSLSNTGDYFSVEGVHLSQMPAEWRPDEPDNVGDDERCLAMWRDGALADVRCADIRPYICYKNKTSDLFMNSCGTSDKAYLEVGTGQCYKYHPECVDWRRAHAVCATEGGHLAVVNSQSEARLLSELFADRFRNTVQCNEDMFLHFGLRNPEGQTNGAPYWFTVEGQTLEEAGFSTWGSDQPDNYGGTEYCGSAFFRNATNGESSLAYNDVTCSRKLAFICEINGPRIPYIDEEPVH